MNRRELEPMRPKRKPSPPIPNPNPGAFGTVRCAFCGTVFPADVWVNQANDCAAYLTGSGVFASYGSKHDGSILIFEQPEPEQEYSGEPAVDICDQCIDRLIEQKLLVKAGSIWAHG